VVRLGSHRRGRVQKDQDRLSGRKAQCGRFNLRVGQQSNSGNVYPFNVTLTIVGTIDKGPVPSFLIFRLDYFEEAAGNPGIAHEFWVRVDDSGGS